MAMQQRTQEELTRARDDVSRPSHHFRRLTTFSFESCDLVTEREDFWLLYSSSVVQLDRARV